MSTIPPSKTSNRELPVSEPARFETVSDLHGRYDDIKDDVKQRKVRTAFNNYVKAYDRWDYINKDGTKEPNFGDFHFRIERERALFEDLALEREQWIRIDPLDAPDEETRKVWSEEISHWFHRFIIDTWHKKTEQTLMDVFEMVMFTHGIEMWLSPLGLYPQSVPVERVFPDMHAGMNPDEWDIFFYEEYFTRVELFKQIGNPGWDKAAIMNLIRSSAHDFNDLSEFDLMKRFRSGGLSNEDSDQQILVIHAFVKEYKEKGGNSISHYVFPDSENIPTDKKTPNSANLEDSRFLKKVHHFTDKFSNIIAVRNHRTHRSYWGCPSTAQLIYVASRFHDKGINKAIRGVFRQLMVFLATNDPDTQERLTNLDDSEVHALNPSDQIQQFRLSVDVAQLMDILRQISIDTDAGTGANTLPGSQNVKGGAITASEANILAGEGNRANESSIRQFIVRDQQLGKEIYRRVTKGKSSEDDDEKSMVTKFRDKMEELKIPKDAYDVDNCIIKSVFSLNAGTAEQKIAVAQAKLQGIRQFAAATTEGERRAVKDILASLDSWENVEYYISRTGTLEVAEQVKAGFENQMLSDPHIKPQNVQVSNDDKHNIHVPIHLNDMELSLTFVDGLIKQIGNSPPQEVFLRIDEAMDILIAQDNKGAHVTAHMELLSALPSEEEILKQYGEKIRQLRQLESQLENQLTAIRQQMLEATGASSVNDENLRHTKQMNAAEEEHESTMQNLQLTERITKTQANSAGAEQNQEQKVRDNSISFK